MNQPTFNSKISQEIVEIFSELNRDCITVMLVTHDALVAAQTERILFMLDGKVVSEMQYPKFDGSRLGERVEKIRGAMRNIGI